MLKFLFLLIFLLFKNAVVLCQNDSTTYTFNPASIRLTRLSSLFDLMPKRQCTHSKAQLCFSEAYETDYFKKSCLDFVKSEFLESEWDSLINKEYTTEFSEGLIECLIKRTQNFTTADENEIVFIPVLEDKYYDIQYGDTVNQTFGSEHEKCVKKKILSCFQRQNCYLISHENAIHEIFPICRYEVLAKMDVEGLMVPKVMAQNKFEAFDELSQQPIDYIPDPNGTKLSSKTIVVFQNLTYGHLEAIKVYLLSINELKKDFCNPTVSLDFYIQPGPDKAKIFSNIPEEFPFIPSETATILSTLTYQDLVAVKNIVNANLHYRWILCSPIVGIAPPMKVTIKQHTKMPPKRDNVPKIDFIKCRDIAKIDDNVKQLICN